MTTFSSMRRDFLRAGSFGVAVAALPAVSFAVSAQTGAAAIARPEDIFDVRKFGATGDGKTLDTEAVNHTIEAAAAVGGGLVVFPAGTYLCFSIAIRTVEHTHKIFFL